MGQRKTSNFNPVLKAIDIISFDVPYPANYGGIIDVFYKIVHFNQRGVKVHLHCFEYGRGIQKELEKYCETVNYYKRKTGTASFLSKLPYIVKSRTHKSLKENLLKNNFPILFEGLHTCFLLADDDLKSRFKIVRAHNVEHNYYKHLAKAEKNELRKHYFKTEAKKLKLFETVIKHANLCITVTHSDTDYFKNTYPNLNTLLIPSFHYSNEVTSNSDLGKYVLYHGNLSVTENINAAKFIIKKVVSDLKVPLIIAGLNPDKKLEQLINNHANCKLIANPTDDELNTLIADAQINLLYTEQATGLKLKLLNVLYNGKHCLANNKMLVGTGLEQCCNIANNAKDMQNTLSELMDKSFTENDINARKKLLSENYSNTNNITRLIENITF